MASGENWTKEETQSVVRTRAQKALDKLKESRKGKKFKLVRLDDKTIKEIEIKD